MLPGLAFAEKTPFYNHLQYFSEPDCRRILKTLTEKITGLLHRLLIELRRFVALFLLPWVNILLFCLIASWYSLFVFGLDALLAPLLKFWFLAKPLLFKTLPAVLFWLWTHTGAKLAGWGGELFALLGTFLGGWKAWSAKKLLRQIGRFLLSLSARFVAVNVLFNLLFGHERRGVKLLPQLAMHQLYATWFGRVLRRWRNSSERQKRLVLGIVICLILVFVGQATLGVSVLLFDLVWELLLFVGRLLLQLWRLLSPLLLKLVPNFIGNFVTQTLIPLIADVVPIIKDDHRVIYLRFNIRRHLRRLKAWLYLKSRARRHSVRKRIKPLLNDNLRARKTALLIAAARLGIANKKKKNDRKHTDHENTYRS